MDAAPVSSKVSWCGPEPSSPSSISSIAVTTITHLHLHNKIWKVHVVVEREDGEWGEKKKARDSGEDDYWCPRLNTIKVCFFCTVWT